MWNICICQLVKTSFADINDFKWFVNFVTIFVINFTERFRITQPFYILPDYSFAILVNFPKSAFRFRCETVVFEWTLLHFMYLKSFSLTSTSNKLVPVPRVMNRYACSFFFFAQLKSDHYRTPCAYVPVPKTYGQSYLFRLFPMHK